MKQERKPYVFEGRTIYEWDESLDTVCCFIEIPSLPETVKIASSLDIKISSKSLSVGFKGTKPYLFHELQGVADSDECVWYLQDKKDGKAKVGGVKQIVVQLQKAQKGVRWGCMFKGHEHLNPIEEEGLKKKMMLERFQQQNPGFDFSGAEFNGQVPEARTFMGGVKYT